MKNSHLLCGVYSYIYIYIYIFRTPKKALFFLGKNLFLSTQKLKHSCFSEIKTSSTVFPWTGRQPMLPNDRRAVPPLQLGVVQGLTVSAEGGVAGGAEEAGHGAPQGCRTRKKRRFQTLPFEAAKHRAANEETSFFQYRRNAWYPIDYFFRVNHIHLQDRWRTLHPCKGKTRTDFVQWPAALTKIKT